MGNLISSVLSGMNAATLGMSTTQHNIANASTPGFSRQSIQLSSKPGQSTGNGYIGQGVDVTTIKRNYSQFLNTQLLNEQAQSSYLDTYYGMIKQLDNLVADPVAGVSPALQEFFSAVNGVVNNPSSVPARQTMLSNAQSVVNRFQEVDHRFDDIASSISEDIESSLTNINAYAQQIATLNDNIRLAAAGDSNRQPNDLLDQLDQALNMLNKEIRVTANRQDDGSVNVFVGNGQSLVIDGRAMSLRTVRSSTDAAKVDVAYISGEAAIPLQQDTLKGGKLGAYLEFRDKTLEPARSSLGRVALGFAESINQQNQLGQDLSGVNGGVLFTTASPRVMSDIRNAGSATMTARIADFSVLTTSDYQLRFDGTNFSALRMSDNVVRNLGPNLPTSVDGFTIDITSGELSAGDVFLIKPTVAGARDINLATNDTSKIAAAAPMRASAALTNTGTGKISNGTVEGPVLNENIRNEVIVSFVDATHFTVFDNTMGTFSVGSPGTLYDPSVGATLSFNGWTAKITGSPKTGDTFTIADNVNAKGDNRNAQELAKLQTKNIMVNSTTTLQGAYGQFVGEVGSKTHELDLTSQAQSSMVAQTYASQQSVSGVNLDEEAANLMQYQRAYQAIAKALQVSNTMFDTLLSAMAR